VAIRSQCLVLDGSYPGLDCLMFNELGCWPHVGFTELNILRPSDCQESDAPAAVQAVIVNVAGVELIAAGGGLMKTTSG
jgi:hypothetical protein